MSLELYRIDVKYACGGVLVDKNIVVNAPPIFSWMKGKDLEFLRKWVEAKNGTMIKS